MLGFLQGQNSLVCGKQTLTWLNLHSFVSVDPFSTPGLRQALLGRQGNEKSFETLKNDPDFQPIWHPSIYC